MTQPSIVSDAGALTKKQGFSLAAGRRKSGAGLSGLALMGLLAASAVLAQQPPVAPQSLPVIQLGAGMYNIKAEVARTPQEHAIGLMQRPSMPVNHGMLFIFERAERQCFWMKNTLMPLSIAFLREDGTVVNTAEMKAGSVDSHCSAEPVRFALEMNQGWFARRGVQPGARITGTPFGAPR